MPDPIFAHPRLAAIYDSLDGERADLAHYADIVEEFGARTVLDIGCGTASFALLLAHEGCSVCAVDPAAASLEVARRKSGAERVHWVLGTVSDAPPLEQDMATMTGNVAQVFLDQDDWHATLIGIRERLRPGGLLVFETRDPDRRAWEAWTPSATRRTLPSRGGTVTAWTELLDVGRGLVTFRWKYEFADGVTLTSDSTLRFRTRSDVESDLRTCGYDVIDIRDAPDRPAMEFVFVARRP